MRRWAIAEYDRTLDLLFFFPKMIFWFFSSYPKKTFITDLNRRIFLAQILTLITPLFSAEVQCTDFESPPGDSSNYRKEKEFVSSVVVWGWNAQQHRGCKVLLFSCKYLLLLSPLFWKLPSAPHSPHSVCTQLHGPAGLMCLSPLPLFTSPRNMPPNSRTLLHQLTATRVNEGPFLTRELP